MAIQNSDVNQKNVDENAKPDPFLNVVLVRSLYETNVGATSRAMANMGADRLILLEPKCEITFAAKQAAATGQQALENRIVYKNWDEFFSQEPDGIRISLTARDGRGRDVRDLSETLEWMRSEHPLFMQSPDTQIPIYLIFGPEDWGLSAKDLELTHYSCSIPTFGDNTSLNLAQAVLLALYTLRQVWGGKRSLLMGQKPAQPGGRAEVFPELSLRTWLVEMGFNVDHSRINAFTVLRRMLLHNVPSAKELSILETVLQQSIRKLREYNEMRRSYHKSSAMNQGKPFSLEP